MDLNRLYFKHQVSMMLVSSTRDTSECARHQTTADGLALRIARFQKGCGAAAATAWNSGGVIPAAAVAKTQTVPSVGTVHI